MATYATYADVQPRVAGRTIDGSSKPTSTEVTAWCTEAEAMIQGALVGGGGTLPAVGTNGATIIKGWVAEYATALTRIAWVAPERDEASEQKVERFELLITKITENPAHFDAVLNGTSGDSSRRCFGYVLDNADSKTITDGDFDPEFTIDMEF